MKLTKNNCSLEQHFAQLNHQHFSSAVPLCKLTWNSRLQTSAGRFHPGSHNPLRPREPMIEVASYLLDIPEGEKHIRDTLLHEMIHYYLWWKKRPYGHTKEFHSILKRVGATRFNPVPKVRAVKYWYHCSTCLIKIPVRRKLGNVACATCCKKFNGGYFSAKFLLQIMDASLVISEKLPSKTVVEEKPEDILPFEKVLQTLSSIRETIKKAKILSSPSSNLE